VRHLLTASPAERQRQLQSRGLRHAGITIPAPSLRRKATMSDTPSTKVYNALFICTHNSARSILAEGLLNSLGQGRFRAYSAGSHPSGQVQPLALKALEAMHIPQTGYRSKDWNEFAQPQAPSLDFVFTVCDQAKGEQCPVWPGQPMTAHWGVPDPSLVVGTPEQRFAAYWDTALTLKRRIELMLALPLASLDRLAIQREIDAIGRR
jgi:arsenate reductase